MTLSAAQLISQASGIYALPELYAQLNRKLEDPHASNTQIADVIQLDAGLSSSLLKIVNSAFYGFPSSISTISQAISIIGRTELAELVLGQSVISVFNQLDISKTDLSKHWLHSLYCGLIAKQIAKNIENNQHSPDSLFVGGLLHDIGKLVIWHELPEQSKKILALPNLSPINDDAVEKDQLGFTHADVGGELLRSWKLPQLLVETTRYHHEPALSADYLQPCQIIALANTSSHLDDINKENFASLNATGLITELGIQLELFIKIKEIAVAQLTEMKAMLLNS